MVIVYCTLSILLGSLSAFSIFAMAFNGYPWTYQVALSLLIACGSAAIGWYFMTWRNILMLFFIPFLLPFALLIMGGIEKGEWSANLMLIALFSIATWIPAPIGNSYANRP